MMADYDSFPAWYQVGWVRYPGYFGGTCSRHYSQWAHPAIPDPSTRIGPCIVDSTAYRYKLRLEGPSWTAEVHRQSSGALVWANPSPPRLLNFTPSEGEYSSETLNARDVAGGGANDSGFLSEAVYWNASDVKVSATVPAGQPNRRCLNCPPYRIDWTSQNSFRIWTEN